MIRSAGFCRVANRSRNSPEYRDALFEAVRKDGNPVREEGDLEGARRLHEAALAAFAIKERIKPRRKVHLQYTTTSPLMHERLGLAEESD